ncbi:DUF3299 domain-containing protein [Pseudogemmatithrix spongiicola]|uniref:DUF3299 domain-containing protein n=1 Tax=Pseudogemmatithrix spongiicola TaxID=3062599 RepID=A0AA49Q9G7_9BACT|nr:DUF3299 domain-containing protein [Gemmatimonadaceae bacterium 'strain 138']WKW16275.1 DUF3299 domain-containing protein [Gemmatimonadaceae bacterium 'strain 318']
MRSLARISLTVALSGAALVAPRLEAQQRPGTAAQSAAVSIDWRLLGQMNPDTRVAPDSLKRLDGRRVRIPGFVVPLDDAQDEGAEFLLVPYYGACVHTPPPPPNQMAFVTMQGGRPIKLALFDAVWMEGTLRIVNYDSPYGSVGFTIEGLSMAPYTGR